MVEFAYSIFGFIIAIGLLVTIHEFGHFWVARLFGVKILRFSVGWGKPLITWHDRQGTEYVIAALPIGGYVKMLDQKEGVVAPNDLNLAFNNKPVWVRMAVFAAGPVFNLLFAVIAYWCVFMLGIAAIVPVIGDVPKGSVAALAGLRSGQEIVAINDKPTLTWEDIAVSLISHVGESNFINLKVYDPALDQQSVHALNVTNWALASGDENIIKGLGLEPLDPMQPIIGKLIADMPAEKAGLQVGDQIINIDGVNITSRTALMQTLHDKYDRAVHLQVKRNDQIVNILITPSKKIHDGGDATGYIGVQFSDQAWPANLIRVRSYTPLAALYQSLARTQEYTVLTFQFLKKMLVGEMSLQHVAGPISIAQFAGRTAESGLVYFLSFLALVSISLGVLNMLPIPILDGGQFLFCIIEIIRGKELSVAALNVAHALGVAILGSFMLLALYNDVIRIMH